MENGLIYQDDEMIPSSTDLIPYGDKQITQLGNLYLGKVNDTLHRVRKYEINFIGGDKKGITYEQYDGISKVITSPTPPKFVRFKDSGDVIAVNQIASIKSKDVLVDTRRENM